jgi:hypothetical protein
MTQAATPRPYIEFKFLLNRMIDLGDTRQYVIPMEMRTIENPFKRTGPSHRTVRVRSLTERGGLTTITDNQDESLYVTQPVFDLDFVHKIELQNELPMLPTKPPGMSQRHHERLCEEAYDAASASKRYNDGIRRRLASYCDRGVLAIVADPFETATEVEGASEFADAMRSAQTPEPAKSKAAKKPVKQPKQ